MTNLEKAKRMVYAFYDDLMKDKDARKDVERFNPIVRRDDCYELIDQLEINVLHKSDSIAVFNGGCYQECRKLDPVVFRQTVVDVAAMMYDRMFLGNKTTWTDEYEEHELFDTASREQISIFNAIDHVSCNIPGTDDYVIIDGIGVDVMCEAIYQAIKADRKSVV